MADKPSSNETLEMRLVTTLAPMLLAIGSFSFAALASLKNSDGIIDDLITLLSLFSIVSAALLIDHLLDSQNKTTMERVTFLGFGYTLFCVAVSLGVMCVLFVFESKHQNLEAPAWNYKQIPVAGFGIATFFKLMTWKDRSASLGAMLVFGVWSWFSISAG